MPDLAYNPDHVCPSCGTHISLSAQARPAEPTLATNAYDLATRFIGLQEARGAANSAAVLAMLQLDAAWVQGDDTAWCSAFVNYIAWLLDLPRSKSLAARSWLLVGRPVTDAEVGFDIVILQRGSNNLGPEVLDAPGHVGFYAGMEDGRVLVLGGNQEDAVSIARFPRARVLGIRRLLG